MGAGEVPKKNPFAGAGFGSNELDDACCEEPGPSLERSEGPSAVGCASGVATTSGSTAFSLPLPTFFLSTWSSSSSVSHCGPFHLPLILPSPIPFVPKLGRSLEKPALAGEGDPNTVAELDPEAETNEAFGEE